MKLNKNNRDIIKMVRINNKEELRSNRLELNKGFNSFAELVRYLLNKEYDEVFNKK